MKFVLSAIAILLGSTAAAEAGPLIPALGSALAGITVGKIIATAAVNLALGYVSSALNKQKKVAKQRAPGIQTERKAQGGTNSRTIMLGYYATAGAEVCPPMSHGRDGENTPNKYLTYVISVSDYPVHGLSRLIMNGEYVPIGAPNPANGLDVEYGNPIGGKYANNAWIRFYDGRQTTADAKMIEHYGAYPDRPWTAQHVGFGCAYAIITCRYKAELYKGEPEFKFEIHGARLYDPRRDSTVGGAGGHRWGDVNTHEYTENPDVIKYNIMRGITLQDGRKWGGKCEFEDVPLTNWVTAMNRCDQPVLMPGGAIEPSYRCGFEVKVAEDEPADVIGELNKASASEIAEIGGIYKIRTGGPGLPVLFITDADFLRNKPKDLDPFPGIADAKNTIYGTFPHPDEMWQAHDVPRIRVDEYYDDDDQEENAEDITFSASPYPNQNQRNMFAWLKDNRRFRVHSATLGFPAFGLEVLDTVAWTSNRNNYSNKDFEIDATAESMLSLSNTLKLREVDPNDYTPPDLYIDDPIASGGWLLPNPQTVVGFGAVAYVMVDVDNKARRPSIRAFWNPDGFGGDVKSINIRYIHLASGAEVVQVVTDLPSGETLLTQVLPGEVYRVTAIYTGERDFIRTDPIDVTTPDVRLDEKDLSEQIFDQIRDVALEVGIKPVDELPETGTDNQIVLKLPQGQLYRWDGAQWTTDIYSGIPDGAIDQTKIAQGLELIRTWDGAALPDEFVADTISWNGKLYKWDADESEYTAKVLGTNAVEADNIIANAINTAHIQAGAVRADQIAAEAVTARHLYIGDLSNLVQDEKFKILSGIWTYEAGTVVVDNPTDGGWTDPRVLEWGINGANDGTRHLLASSKLFTVEPNTWYTGRVTVGTRGGSSTPELTIHLTYYKRDGSQITNNYGILWNGPFLLTGVPQIIEAKVLPPNDAVTARLDFFVKRGIANGTNIRFARPFVRKTNGGSLIVDGSIVANLIAADAITSDKIIADAIVASKIASGAITAVKLAADSVTASAILAGSITAAKVAAGAITADKIRVGDGANVIDQGFQAGDLSRWGYSGLLAYYYDGNNGWVMRTSGRDTVSDWFDVVPGAAYSVVTGCNNSQTPYQAFIGLFVKYRDGSQGYVGPESDGVTAVITPAGGYNERMGGIVRLPFSAYQARVVMVTDRSGTGNGSGVFWFQPSARRCADESFIANLAITNAKIRDASITRAKIGQAAIGSAEIEDLTVGTIKITNGAVTNAATFRWIGSTTSDTTFYINCNGGTNLNVIITYTGIFSNNNSGTRRVRLTVNGNTFHDLTFITANGMNFSGASMINMSSIGGGNPILVRFEGVQPATIECCVFALEAKK